MQGSDKPVRLSWSGMLAGARYMLPIALFAVPFGVAFGAAALEAGLARETAMAMSALVFAGAGQFAALEFWVQPIDIAALLLAVFAVNARHILMGAALYPWMRRLPWGRRHLAAGLITDANWAYAMEAQETGERDLGILVGSGLAMWLCWGLGTAAGAFLGEALAEPRRFGLDVVMVAFFACVLAAMARRDAALWSWLLPWLAAAAAAIAATWVLPPGWHVIAGGLVGGLVGAFGRD